MNFLEAAVRKQRYSIYNDIKLRERHEIGETQTKLCCDFCSINDSVEIKNVPGNVNPANYLTD